MNRRSLLAGLFALPTVGLALPAVAAIPTINGDRIMVGTIPMSKIVAGTIMCKKLAVGSLAYDVFRPPIQHSS